MTKDSTETENAYRLGCDIPDVTAPLIVGGLSIPNRAFLAPLSGISDVPFRRIARRFGAGLVVSEMVASGEFVAGDDESALRAMADGSGLHVVQLAGRDPAVMRAAAEKLSGLGVDAIDINMGCPAKKVVGGLSGSALMREPDLAMEIVEATVAGAGSVPVTLKMRLGWDERSINAPWLASRAEGAGVRMVTVHGRTRQQFYEGRANWPAIAAVKAAVGIPVVANGDLTAMGQEAGMLSASTADAVMIGRGACGRPWLPGVMAKAAGAENLERIGFGDLVREHYESMMNHYGLRTGVRHARKHLGWYLDRYAEVVGVSLADDRRVLMTSDDPVAVGRHLTVLLGGTSVAEIHSAVPSPLRKAA